MQCLRKSASILVGMIRPNATCGETVTSAVPLHHSVYHTFKLAVIATGKLTADLFELVLQQQKKKLRRHAAPGQKHPTEPRGVNTDAINAIYPEIATE